MMHGLNDCICLIIYHAFFHVRVSVLLMCIVNHILLQIIIMLSKLWKHEPTLQ